MIKKRVFLTMAVLVILVTSYFVLQSSTQTLHGLAPLQQPQSSSGQFARRLAEAIGRTAIEQNGVRASARETIRDQLVDTALAHHAGSCSGVNIVDQVLAQIKRDMGDDDDPHLDVNSFCLQAKVKGTIDYSLYGDKRRENFALKVSMNLRIDYKAFDPKNCDRTITGSYTLKGQFVVRFYVSPSGQIIIDPSGEESIPSDYELICHSQEVIDRVGGTLDKTKCPYCLKNTTTVGPPS